MNNKTPTHPTPPPTREEEHVEEHVQDVQVEVWGRRGYHSTATPTDLSGAWPRTPIKELQGAPPAGMTPDPGSDIPKSPGVSRIQ